MINNNHETTKVPEGYKQTEIGILPKDWGKLSIGKNTILHARIGWQSLTTAEYMISGDYFLVTGTDFDAGEVNWDRCCFVSEWRFRQDTKIQLKQDDVLITKDGTIGKIGFVDALKKQATLNSGIFVIRPKNNIFIPKYLFYILTSHFFKDFINRITAGSTIVHLYQKDFVGFEFYVPKSLKEQTAIANALSDVDALIAELERLIAKKEAIKTGTMQQLLTGRTRLPQFAKREDGTAKGYKTSELGEIPEDWSYSKLIDILMRNPQYGLNAPAVPLARHLPTYIRITDINENSIYAPDVKVGVDHPLAMNYLLEDGDIVLARTGASVGKSYQYKISDGPLVFAGFLIKIKPNPEKLISGFVAQYLKTDHYWNWVLINSMRSGQPGINSTEYGRMLIPLPSIKEQTEIAEILSDMDSEIEVLEKRLEKTKALKQGMMQELLTGRTRLV